LCSGSSLNQCFNGIIEILDKSECKGRQSWLALISENVFSLQLCLSIAAFSITRGSAFWRTHRCANGVSRLRTIVILKVSKFCLDHLLFII
jgi:hypothetical protein